MHTGCVLRFRRPKRKDLISNIIVVDDPGKWKLHIEDVRIISAKSYHL
jgi:hypothetical protein